MSEAEQKTETPEANPARSGEMIRALVGVAAVSGILISVVFQWTLPAIKANRAEALQKAVFAVIPGVKTVVTFEVTQEGKLVALTEDKVAEEKMYAGYDQQGQLAGVALEAQGQGYQDVIKILYGYNPEKEHVVGINILDSKETPGLGDKIGKDPKFLANFEALDVRLKEDRSGAVHPLEVVKQGTKSKAWQIDSITGATISSKAVGKILNASVPQRLPVVQKNLDTLKEKP